jgi:hypothetical protein
VLRLGYYRAVHRDRYAKPLNGQILEQTSHGGTGWHLSIDPVDA